MAAKYWLQAGTGTWSTVTTPWRTTDGGSTLTSAPTTLDDVYFSSCNAGTVTLSGTLNCKSLNITTGSAMTFTGTGAINCLGDITVPSNITWNGTGTFTSTGTSITHAISFTPATGGPSLTCSGTGSVHNFNAAYTTRVATSFVQLSSGTLNLNDWNITCGFFSSDASASRTINFGSGGVYLVDTTAARTVVNFLTATLLSCTGTGGFYTNMSTTRTFSLGTTTLGATYNLSPANITLYAGASIATFTTNGYVRNLDLSSYTGSPASTIMNICGDLSLGSGTYTGLSPIFRGPVGSTTFNTNSKTIGSVNVIMTVIETVLYINGTFTCTTMTTTSGTVDFQNNNVTATSSMTYTGTAANAYWNQTATVTTPTFNLSSTPYFNFDQGTLNVTTMAHSNGTFRLGGGTLNLGNGTSTGSYTFSAGLLDLNDQVLTVPNTFSSSNTGVRSIYVGDYSSGYIIVRNLSAATLTNFTWTGGVVGTFAIKPTATSVPVVITWGNTAGITAANRVNISFTTVDVALSSSWCSGTFESINFGTIAVTVGAPVSCNCKYLTLSATGTFTSFSATMAFADSGFSGDNPMGTLTLAAGAGNNVTMSGVCRVANWTTTSGNLLSSGDPYGYDSIIVTGTWTWSSSSFVIAQNIWESCPNITCLNFTLSNATWATAWPTSFVTTGTITLSTNGILTHGDTWNGWGSCATLTQSGAGSVANLGNYSTGSFTVTGVYTLTAGTLNMQGYDLYIGGSLSASSSSTRAINFSGANIYITSTTSSTGLTAATLTLLSTDQTGTIQVNAATIRKSLTWGSTAGGSTSNAVSVVMYGGGVLNPTITTGSWFEVLDLQGLDGSNNQQSGITINITESLILPPSGATPRPTDYALCTVVFQGPTLASAITGYLNCNDRISTSGTIGVLTFAMTGTVALSTEVTVGATGAATGITTLTSGTLDINGQALNTNTFVSSNANTRALAYNGGSIYVNSTASTAPVSLATATNFTITPGQTGAFIVPMNISKTFQFGTTGGSVNFAPNVTLTPETALATTPVPTLTTGGWFGVLDISASSATIATTSLNVTSLNLGSGDYSNMTITVFGDGYISGVDHKEIGAITIGNGVTITTTFYQSFRMTGALTINNTSTVNANGQSLTPASITLNGGELQLGGGTVAAGTGVTHTTGNVILGGGTLSTVTYSLTAGAISLGGGNLNVQTFSSSSAGTRSITGTGTVNCAGNWTTTNGGTFTKGTVDSYTINMVNSSAKTFAGGGGAFGTLVQAGAGALTVTGSNSFGDVQQTLIAPTAASQALFTSVGWSYWTVPAGVYSISAVAVGGGGGTFWAETGGAPFSGISGGGGGGLAYANSMSVFPGQILVVYVGGGGYARAGGPPSPLPSVGIAGGPSYIGSSGAAWIRGGGGGAGIGNSTTSNPGGTGGTSTGTLRAGGGTGGAGGAVNADTMPGAGGGGAGGYSGNGGAAGTVTATAGVAGAAGAASSGAAGAGGSGGAAAIGGAAGGGVNVYGIGTTGAAGPIQTTLAQQGGYGGSSGGDGSGTTAGGDNGGYGGGGYGGGGGGGADDSGAWCGGAAYAAQGAIRVIWGDARSFPSNAPDV